jgi:hypothetical protein
MFPELGPANTTLDATDFTNIETLYGDGSPQTAAANGSLIQAMAAFGASPPSSLGALPTPPLTAEATLAPAYH